MMELAANFHFIRPAWLGLAPVAIVLWVLWRRRTEPLRGWREQMDPELLQAVVIGRNPNQDYSAYWLLATWMIAAVAVAGPTWRLEPNPFASDSEPLMILLKADASMNVADPPPSRMERAHLKIADIANARQGQPMGLIAYAGSAHLVLPPTRDTTIVSEMASQVTPDIMPVAGDRLDLAIREAGKLMRDEREGGSLLVIADAANIDSRAVTAALSSESKMPIQFLSISSANAEDAQSIRSLASALGAQVQTLTIDDQDVNTIVEFAERRSSGGIAGEGRHWQEAGYWLTPAIGLIVAMSFRRQRKVAPENSR